MHNHAHHNHRGHFAGCAQKRGCMCESRRYAYVLFISMGILAVEIIGWRLSNSLALLGDSGHVAADAIAISVALLISVRVRRQPLKQARATRTFGFAIQILLLAVVGTWVFIEGIMRFFEPPHIFPLPLLIAAVAGGSANLWQVSLLEGGFRNFTAHGTRAYPLSGLVTSVGVVVGAIVIAITGWHVIDPILSLAIALFIFYQVFRLFTLANRERKRAHVDILPRL